MYRILSMTLAVIAILASLWLPAAAVSADADGSANTASVERATINYDRTGYPNTYTNTGDYAKDIIGVATTQLGYAENSSAKDYTKYSRWYFGQDYKKAWCAMFVSWCADQAGIPTDIIQKNDHAYGATYDTYVNGTAMFSDDGYFGGTAYEFGTKTPEPGDIFFSVTSQSYDYSTHVGLVWKVVGNTIYTIEGNTHFYDSKTGDYVGKVAQRQYSLSTGYQYYGDSGYSSYSHLLFFVHPDYASAEKHMHSYKTLEIAATCTQQGYTTYTCSCGDTYNANYTAATGHVWDNGTPTTTGTAAQATVVTYHCRFCRAEKTVNLSTDGLDLLLVRRD